MFLSAWIAYTAAPSGKICLIEQKYPELEIIVAPAQANMVALSRWQTAEPKKFHCRSSPHDEPRGHPAANDVVFQVLPGALGVCLGTASMTFYID